MSRGFAVRLLLALDSARNALLVGILALMVLVYTASFTSRYVPAVGSLNWAEELTRFLHVWAVFIGYGYLVRRGGHISTDVLVVRLPRSVQRGLIMAAHVLLSALSAVFVWYGVEMTLLNADQQAPSLGMVGIDALRGWPTSMAWPYLAIPFGGAVALLDQLALLLDAGSPRALEPVSDTV